MACRSPAGAQQWRFKAMNPRTGKGQPGRCPFQIGSGMDAKTHNLVLLVGLSVFCAAVAWISDYSVLGSVFFAFGGVAAIEIAWDHWH
jgi:hypothetical protein